MPHLCRKDPGFERVTNYSPPETWFEPREVRDTPPRVITEAPGKGYVHAVTAAEITIFLSRLPPAVLESIFAAVDVIKLSGRTRKNSAQNIYGLQWGSAVYMYPFPESLTEIYVRPPRVETRIETERYGGRWSPLPGGFFELRWTPKSLRDYYLCEILMHEIGHGLDTKNVSFNARERFANAFATEYGYLPWKEAHQARRISKRHHSSGQMSR